MRKSQDCCLHEGSSFKRSESDFLKKQFGLSQIIKNQTKYSKKQTLQRRNIHISVEYTN